MMGLVCRNAKQEVINVFFLVNLLLFRPILISVAVFLSDSRIKEGRMRKQNLNSCNNGRNKHKRTASEEPPSNGK